MIFGTAKDLQSRAARAADSVTRLCIGSSFDLGLAIRKLEAHFWPRGCRSSTAYRKTHSFGRMGKLPSRAHSWSPLNTNMDMPTSRHLSFTFLNTSNDNYGWPERSLHEKSVVGLTGIQPKLTKLCCQLVAHCWLVAVLQSTQTMIYSQLTALKLSDSIFLWKGEVQYLDAGGKILPDLKFSYQSPGSLQPPKKRDTNICYTEHSILLSLKSACEINTQHHFIQDSNSAGRQQTLQL